MEIILKIFFPLEVLFFFLLQKMSVTFLVFLYFVVDMAYFNEKKRVTFGYSFCDSKVAVEIN